MKLLAFLNVYLCLLWAKPGSSEDVEWNYSDRGPDVWPDIFPQCAGSSQSPIDIKSKCAIYRSFPSFNFSASYSMNQQFIVKNNGHTVVISAVNQTGNPLLVMGGGLNGTYQFVNMHLHWGENYASGSEHEVDGKKYAGEVHFVHISEDGSNYAALGFFLTTVKRDSGIEHDRRRRKRRYHENIAWYKFLESVSVFNETDQTMDMTLNLTSLMGSNLTSFWRYKGSFTTPGCDEIVTWTVFSKDIEISDKLLGPLRENVIPRNYRHIQPLNQRTIYRSFGKNMTSSEEIEACCS